MSRIGRMPIGVPAGVTVKIDGNVVSVKGPKGELTRTIPKEMIVEIGEGVVNVSRPSEEKQHKSLHGLTRTLVANMVTGVTKGFSHPVVVEPPAGITIDVPAPNRIVVSGINKEAVGALAAKIRSFREPEPYKGKGIKYEGEVVRRKVGKAGGKGKK